METFFFENINHCSFLYGIPYLNITILIVESFKKHEIKMELVFRFFRFSDTDSMSFLSASISFSV